MSAIYNARKVFWHFFQVYMVYRSSENLIIKKNSSSESRGKNGSFWKDTFSFFFELLVILLIVLGIRTFIATPFQIEGSSMNDTLLDQEKIFVNKIPTYFDNIQRGDIVVFIPPYYRMIPKKGPLCFIKQKFSKETDLTELCGEEPQHYVKRVVGIEGDIVRIEGGKVFITPENEEEYELKEMYLNDRNQDRTCFSRNCVSSEDTNGRKFVVPEDKFFVLGDNRLSSSDSRSAIHSGSAFNNGTANPFVPLENITGAAQMIIWPFDRWEWL